MFFIVTLGFSLSMFSVWFVEFHAVLPDLSTHLTFHRFLVFSVNDSKLSNLFEMSLAGVVSFCSNAHAPEMFAHSSQWCMFVSAGV